MMDLPDNNPPGFMSFERQAADRAFAAKNLENEACEAVIAEFRAFLAQNETPEPILKLCRELESRIALRRLVARDLDSLEKEKEA